MLPDIIPSRSIPRCAPWAQISRPRQTLEIASPIYFFCIKQIHQRRDVGGYPYKIIMVQSKVVATNRGNVIGLRGVREAVVFCKENALFREINNVGIDVYFREILRALLELLAQRIRDGGEKTLYLVL